MGDSHSHDLSRQVKIYICVFIALLVGTLVTVGMYYVHFTSMAVTVAVALFIASVKGFLVAGFFMHLISERRAIYAILLATVFFFTGMMYLTVWSRDATPRGTVFHGSPSTTKPETAKSPH